MDQESKQTSLANLVANAFAREVDRRQLLRGGLLFGAGALAWPLVEACASASSTVAGAGTFKGLGHFITNVTSLISANRGFRFALEQLGDSFTEQSYDGDPQKAISQAELFGATGVKGATSYLVSDALYTPYGQSLAKQHIAYFNYANRAPWRFPLEAGFNGYFIAHSNGSFAEEAYIVNKTLFQKAGGQGEMLWFRGVPGDASDTARSYGVLLALKEFPGIKIVGQQPVYWDRVKAQAAAEALIPAHPNARIFVGQNDSIALGVMAAVRAARRNDVFISGVDADPEWLQEMTKDPRAVVTAAGRLDHTGVLAAVRIYDFINGVKYNPLESMLNTDSIVVDTPESAKAMLDLIGQAPGPLPYDVKKYSRHLQGDKWEYNHKVTVADPVNFDWGSKPGVNPHPMPGDFSWPTGYKEALDRGDLDKLNAEYGSHLNDVYGPVRAKATYKGAGVIGIFKSLGIG